MSFNDLPQRRAFTSSIAATPRSWTAQEVPDSDYDEDEDDEDEDEGEDEGEDEDEAEETWWVLALTTALGGDQAQPA